MPAGTWCSNASTLAPGPSPTIPTVTFAWSMRRATRCSTPAGSPFPAIRCSAIPPRRFAPASRCGCTSAISATWNSTTSSSAKWLLFPNRAPGHYGWLASDCSVTWHVSAEFDEIQRGSLDRPRFLSEKRGHVEGSASPLFRETGAPRSRQVAEADDRLPRGQSHKDRKQ